jgi:hypothetical protein
MIIYWQLSTIRRGSYAFAQQKALRYFSKVKKGKVWLIEKTLQLAEGNG